MPLMEENQPPNQGQNEQKKKGIKKEDNKQKEAIRKQGEENKAKRNQLPDGDYYSPCPELVRASELKIVVNEDDTAILAPPNWAQFYS
ncbi:hypothetical protein DFAR_3990015 [Desulfarculales bacterium]